MDLESWTGTWTTGHRKAEANFHSHLLPTEGWVWALATEAWFQVDCADQIGFRCSMFVLVYRWNGLEATGGLRRELRW